MQDLNEMSVGKSNPGQPTPFQNRGPDLEGDFHLRLERGRITSVFSGYRPAHKLFDNYLSSGNHHYPDNDGVAPGETARALVWLITPDVYPHCVWEGREIELYEGRKIIGTLKVTRVFNTVLLGQAADYSPMWVAPPGLE
jgi:hypothetical protein